MVKTLEIVYKFRRKSRKTSFAWIFFDDVKASTIDIFGPTLAFPVLNSKTKKIWDDSFAQILVVLEKFTKNQRSLFTSIF